MRGDRFINPFTHESRCPEQGFGIGKANCGACRTLTTCLFNPVVGNLNRTSYVVVLPSDEGPTVPYKGVVSELPEGT